MDESTSDIDDVLLILNSIDDFDVEKIGMLCVVYFLFFSSGYIAGTVIKLMKRS